MLDNTYKIVFLIFFIAGVVVRMAGIRVSGYRRDRGKRSSSDSMSRKEVPVMFLSFIGMQVLPLVYVFTSWLDFIDYHLPTWAGLSGVVVFTIALWLLWRSHTDLGRNFSPEIEIKDEAALVTNGVFRYIRHPMYAAHWLWAVAQALLLQNWIAGPAFLVAFIFMYIVRVPLEEETMLEHFGDEYREYMKKTGRIIPRLLR
ncbi:MAG: protein-S-isoprenylcysteine O-methyltransferase [Halobacteriota archaeon]|nr:protein-S-isoprenylcysteine O-methyltransferase [Halobacteriota archaeon]